MATVTTGKEGGAIMMIAAVEFASAFCGDMTGNFGGGGSVFVI
jgi:hypothetical protein